MTELSKLYSDILSSQDDKSIIILKDISGKAILFTKVLLLCGLLTSIGFMVIPVMYDDQDLPLGISIQGVNYHWSPLYEIILLTFFSLTLLMSFLYVSYTGFLISFISFGIILLKILLNKFETISECDQVYLCPNQQKAYWDRLIEKRFRVHIELHKRISRYMKELNELFTTVCLVELCVLVSALSVLLLVVIVADTTSIIIIDSFYIILLSSQMFIQYWAANELMVQSSKLTFVIYDLPWYHFSEKNKKTLLIILTFTMDPMKLMLGNFAIMNLETYQTVLNAAYSYFTILRRSITN